MIRRPSVPYNKIAISPSKKCPWLNSDPLHDRESDITGTDRQTFKMHFLVYSWNFLGTKCFVHE